MIEKMVQTQKQWKRCRCARCGVKLTISGATSRCVYDRANQANERRIHRRRRLTRLAVSSRMYHLWSAVTTAGKGATPNRAAVNFLSAQLALSVGCWVMEDGGIDQT